MAFKLLVLLDYSLTGCLVIVLSYEIWETLLFFFVFVLQFRKWFDEAVAAGLRETNAMALSTTNKDRKP